LATHPGVTLGWAEQGIRMLALNLRAKPASSAVASVREVANGQLPITGGAIASCDGIRHDRLPDAAWIGDLRRRYGRDGTRVIVDATPTTDCDASLKLFHEHVDGLIDDSPLPTMPIADFSSDGRLHTNEAGSRVLSTMVAKQIMNQMSAAPDGGGER
jgi:hypothetical protein